MKEGRGAAGGREGREEVVSVGGGEWQEPVAAEQEGVAVMEEQRCALELTCRLNAAACLLRLGRGAGAVDECSRALRLGGAKRDEALCFRRRARAHLLLGELDAARVDCRSLRAVLAAAPNEAETAELTRLEARIGAPRCPVRNIGEGTGLLAGARAPGGHRALCR